MNIWNTRPIEQSHETTQLLSEIKGVKVFPLPVISIVPLKSESAENLIEESDALLFVSRNAVLAWNSLGYQKVVNSKEVKLIAIGDGTAKQMLDIGLIADYVCQTPFSSESLLADNRFWDVGFNCLLVVGGKDGRQLIVDTVVSKQKKANKLICYRRDKLEINKQFMLEFVSENKIDAILITSIDILNAVVALLRQLQDGIAWTAITVFALSQRVAGEAMKLGFSTVVTCSEASQVALVETVRNRIIRS